MTLLQLAAMNGSATIAEALLDKGVKIDDSTFSCDLSALHIASLLGNTDVVSLLLDKKAYVNIQLEANYTPLHLAAMTGHKQIMKDLLDHKADPKLKDIRNRTPIEIAVSNGHQGAVEVLSEYVDMNADYDHNSTLLHIAVEAGDLSMVQYLISHGVNFDVGDSTGAKALHIAAKFNHVDILYYILSLYDLEMEDLTLLMHTAALEGSIEVLQYLIEQQLDVNCLNSDGETPLHVAAWTDNENVVRLLLNNGAYYNVSDRFGMIPLEITNGGEIYDLLEQTDFLFKAVRKGDCDVVEKCLYNGVIVNAKDIHNATPLHYAAQNGYEGIVICLIINGANLNCFGGENDCTPLHEAAKHSHWGIVKSLLSYGAIYNYQTHLGKTPLDEALDCDHSLSLNIFNSLFLIKDSFLKIKNGNSDVINELQNVTDIDVLKAVMNAQNKEKNTLIHFATLHNFNEIEKLKQIGQKDYSIQMKEVTDLKTAEKYDEALTLLKNILDKRTTVMGSSNPAIVEIKLMIADIVSKKLEYDKAQGLYEDIYNESKMQFGEKGRITLKTQVRIASILHSLGKDKEAMNICEEIYKNQLLLTNNQNDILFTLSQRASIFESLGRHKDALSICDKILQNNSIDVCSSSEDITILLETQNIRARILGKQGKYNDAYLVYEENCDKIKTIFGPWNSLTLRTIREMALILIQRKKFNEALQRLQHILGIQLSILGPKHPEVLITHQYIAKLYFTQERNICALKMYFKTFHYLESSLGPSNAIVLDSKHNIEKISLLLKFNISYGTKLLEQIEIGVVGDNDCVSENLWEDILKNGVNINSKNSDGWSFLHCAAMGGKKDMMEIILKKGADIMCVNDLGETSLHISASNHDVHAVELLMRHIESNCVKLSQFINVISKKGDTALHAACSSCACKQFPNDSSKLNTIRYLLQWGAIYNIQNNELKKPINVTEDDDIKSFLKKIEDFFKNITSSVCSDITLYELQTLSIEVFQAVTTAQNLQRNTLLQEAFLRGPLNVAKELENMIKLKKFLN